LRRNVNFVCLNPVSNVIIRFNFSAPQMYFVVHLFLQCCKFLFLIFRILGGKWNTNPLRTDQQSLPTRKTAFYVHVKREFAGDVFGYPLRWKAYEDNIWSLRRNVNFVFLNPVSNIILWFNFVAIMQFAKTRNWLTFIKNISWKELQCKTVKGDFRTNSVNFTEFLWKNGDS